jgi:hypothetical protein
MYYMEVYQENSLCSYLKQLKLSFFLNLQNQRREQEGAWEGWYQWEGRKRWGKGTRG